MKKLLLTAIAALVFVCSGFTQFTTVNYDFERNWFNEGQPLPAEKSMVFKGMIPADAEIVELKILSSKRSDELYQATWIKVDNNELSLIVPYKLRASEDYDFVLNFYNPIDAKDAQRLEEKLMNIMDTYIDVHLSGSKENSIKFLKKNKKILKEMNELVEENLDGYRTKRAEWYPAFSELVKLKLEKLEKTNLSSDYVKGDTTTTKKAVRKSSKESLINDLKDQLHSEIKLMLDTDLYMVTNSRFVDNYMTEDKQNSLAINAGYGGVYLSGNWDDFTYGASPYLGLSFPLGNSVLGSKFLSNTSVTIGVFTDNFKDEKGNKVTGFLVNRPIYLGLDHKLFKFIRVNAGGTFLEGIKVSDVPDVEPTKNIMIRPYVGLSARIDISVGLGK